MTSNATQETVTDHLQRLEQDGQPHRRTNEPIHDERPMKIICIGAGASGLLLAYKLQRSFNNFELVLYEKNEGISGTWFENRYPGCACDVPAHTYTWSFEPKYDWSSVYAGSEEIKVYFETFATKYKLHKYVKLSHRVDSATWNDTTDSWDVQITDLARSESGDIGRNVIDRADILVNASGVLNAWQWPNIPGLHDFKGVLMHTADWNRGVDLTGLRVGLIGNGSSGIQVLPAIQPKVAQLKTFIRHPTWVSPTQGFEQHFYSEKEKDHFRTDPKAHLAYRKEQEDAINTIFPMFIADSPIQQANFANMVQTMKGKLEGVGTTLTGKLVPNYGVGCRRLTPGVGYLESLSMENVDVVYGEIQRITEKGCLSADGVEHELDALGNTGQSMKEVWSEEAKAYLGVAVAGFPNYFLVIGPNSPIGNGPVLSFIEAQIDYMLKFANRWQTENIRSFSPKQDAVEDFIAHKDDFMKNTVWEHDCRSWYKANSVSGKVSALWPGSTLHYMEAIADPRYDDWEITYKGNRFAWLGNGLSQTEVDETADLSYYIRNHDDSPFLSRGKALQQLPHTSLTSAVKLLMKNLITLDKPLAKTSDSRHNELTASRPFCLMANYLPVLLVSVAANSIPDDSSLSTLPRGQVDYLSHNWEEEDVWRSWRNMTRQKNEIANGARLENASWRTWWKQRNGLGTVMPETLNWLKDSDVTWLYGPLHTAVDWAPPPKATATAQSALDLSTTHKPILKHRSISQLLISDLPVSPTFSPAESDDEVSYFSRSLEATEGSEKPRRPTLSHTKSDTHITRWRSNRPFRKDSPPRIDPPAQQPASPPGVQHSDGDLSNTNSTSSGTTANADRQKKRHISFNTFVQQCIAIDKPNQRSAHIGYDEEDEDQVYVHQSVTGRYPYGRNSWGYDDGYEEDAEEDSDEEAEASSPSMWDEQLPVSPGDDFGLEDEEVVKEDDPGREGNSVVEIRPSFSTRTKPNSSRSQSTASTTSTSSSASTSTSISNSTSSTSESPDHFIPARRPPHRRSSTSTVSTYRPRFTTTSESRRNAPSLTRASTGDRSRSGTISQAHVTIAPIAPTILKTSNYGYYGHHPGGWSEGFGDEGGSDDGIWAGAGGATRWWGEKGKGRGTEESDGSGGQTPVELVYVPPFGSNYNFRAGRDREREREQRMFVRERERERERSKGAKVVTRDVMEDHEDGFGNGDQDVYRRRATLFSVGDDEVDLDADGADTATATGGRGLHMGAPVPTVVVGRETQGRTDVGDDFRSRRSSSSSLSQGPPAFIETSRGRSASQTNPAERGKALDARSRSKSASCSKSRSRSRTPSPALITHLSTDSPSGPTPAEANSGPGHTHAPVIIPRRNSSASLSPTSASASLLSPPPRSSRASQSFQDVALAYQQPRGRSNTRSASSFSDRERSTGSTSLGSLSPEGLDFGGVAGAYTGGRYERDRDRDRKDDREKLRGRERPEIRKSGSLQGPDGVQDSLLRVSPASTSHVSLPAPEPAPRLNVVTPRPKASIYSSSSSSSSQSTSSTVTIMPSAIAPVAESEATSLPSRDISVDVRRAEERQRYIQPTPSNSPIIRTQAVPVAVSAAGSGVTIDSETARPASLASQMHTSSAGTSTSRIKSPLVVSAVAPAEPSTSYSISPPRTDLSPPSSPRSLSREQPTLVGKAVEMVSSAGAFLGLWNQ
ncbi:hypothetical protein H0H93_010386 [Arthromyces matolae]|nr:hypothetical protein H0H93_010386 [Arthromyces matolae]